MLGRVNAGHAHFFAVLGQSGLTELSTHFRQQRILYGFRQIRGFNLGRIDLPAGKYTLTFRAPGHKPHVRKTEVTENAVTIVPVDMQRE